MDTICGHERKWLVFNLGIVDRPIQHLAVLCPSERACLNDVQDPAKLAEMLVSEAKRLGAEVVWRLDMGQVYPDVPTLKIQFSASHGQLHILYVSAKSVTVRMNRLCVSLPDARAILLQWIRLADGTPIANVMKALEAA